MVALVATAAWAYFVFNAIVVTARLGSDAKNCIAFGKKENKKQMAKQEGRKYRSCVSCCPPPLRSWRPYLLNCD